ncbi:MAG: hypothetical protein SVZ03_06770 [Spirochaetota bacterium]|nr:hypothetical protein [Spirochaetota bacterium]
MLASITRYVEKNLKLKVNDQKSKVVPIKEYFRKQVINYFKDTDRITDKIARNLLSWKHSGFNIHNSIRIMGHDNKAREALAQYIARCPISLKKNIYEPVKSMAILKQSTTLTLRRT